MFDEHRHISSERFPMLEWAKEVDDQATEGVA
jgi:hypothetical protein